MGLQKEDLIDTVDHIIEIDSYASKMGEDRDIVTLSFSTTTKESANDLAGFIERGYEYVLDADVTAGEQSDGTYKVFVELQRDSSISENIMELANGVVNLTGEKDFRFRYHKQFRSMPLTVEELTKAVPNDPELYGVDSDILTDMTESKNNYTNFFNKSMLENVNMWSNMITLKKAYADPVAFQFIDFGPTEKTINNIEESFNPNDFSEIIFLTKYLGDYNITKYGTKLTFDNDGETLVLERIML
jgi:hypothetical protein